MNARRAVLALGALLLAGCSWLPWRSLGEPPPSVTWHADPAAGEPLRVVVLPFALAEGVGKGAAELSPAFAASLRALGRHEVIRVPPSTALPVPDLGQGSVPIDVLLAVRDATGCDAVVIGRVEHFDSFPPVSLGAALHLVSCHDGAVLWSAQAQLEGRREDVQADIRAWWSASEGERGAPINGWRSVLSTPRDFCRYAADRLAWTVVHPPKP
ncbi:MAG: hypothetical protein RMM29_00930 [Planctomycetota bacterium]|nr:hypothetical protein [Planctomycetota bacterium]MCX8039089.1 hypothetical protein [Planctomycetota bacterium]MDW8372199.1 hypothetical protein [Planctomycetota bacterium]